MFSVWQHCVPNNVRTLPREIFQASRDECQQWKRIEKRMLRISRLWCVRSSESWQGQDPVMWLTIRSSQKQTHCLHGHPYRMTRARLWALKSTRNDDTVSCRLSVRMFHLRIPLTDFDAIWYWRPIFKAVHAGPLSQMFNWSVNYMKVKPGMTSPVCSNTMKMLNQIEGKIKFLNLV
jgi:hypothetical protein